MLDSPTLITKKNLHFFSVDAQWCTWEAWTGCSETCGLGEGVRTRQCGCPMKLGAGSDCMPLNDVGGDEEGVCNGGYCCDVCGKYN